MLFQQIINGLSVGSVYALMAVGYSLIYSLLNFTNFAHAVAVTVGAYVGYFLFLVMQPYLFAGIVVSLFLGMTTSVIIDVAIYRTMLNRKNSKKLYLTLAGWGVSTIAENLVVIFIGSLSRFYPNSLTSMGNIKLGSNSIGRIDLIILLVSVTGVVALQTYISFSRDGLAMRGAAYNLQYAKLMGINTNRLLLKVFAIAGMLAGTAGIFMGIKYTAYPTLGSAMTNKAFIAAVLGGLGSLPGAILGAFSLGVIEVFVAGYLSSALRDMISYGILILVLIVRPTGFMGKSSEDKA